MVELGTKIIGDFGAMIPLWEGKVVNIKTYDVGPSTPEITIKWDNGWIRFRFCKCPRNVYCT